MGRSLAEERRGRGARLPVKLRLNKTEVDVGDNQTGETTRLKEQRPGSGAAAPLVKWRAGGKQQRGSWCLKENSLPLALLVCKLIGPI